MTLRHEPADALHTVGRQPGETSKKEAAFRGHLTVYLVMALFFFSLNLLTSPGDWWFYWPLFFWGWALIFQAVATYGSEAPARVLDVLRAIVPSMATDRPTATTLTGRLATTTPFAATAFAAVHGRIERLKEIAGQIPEGPVRDKALGVSATAERIVATMAADRADAETVGWFDSQLLAPAESLLNRYSRLTGRGVAGAADALRQVEEHDLPLLQGRFDALYDQLLRGEIVDLAVTSEMLDLAPPMPPSLRTRP